MFLHKNLSSILDAGTYFLHSVRPRLYRVFKLDVAVDRQFLITYIAEHILQSIFYDIYNSL